MKADNELGNLGEQFLDFHDGSERLFHRRQHIRIAAGTSNQLVVDSLQLIGLSVSDVVLPLQQPEHFLSATRFGRHQALYLVDSG